MSNRKGFTLVELLAVITILAIIVTIAIPSTMSISKRLKTNLYCNKIELINTAAELYGENRKDSFSTEIEIDGKTYSGRKIQVKDLVTTNYLKKDQSDSPYIVDPRDKTSDGLYNLELVIYKKYNRIHVAFNDTINETCNIDKNSIDFSKYIVENEEVKTNSGETTTFANYIVNLAKTDTTNLAYDETSDNNLRYIGADPDNYLCFDASCSNGKWRVIGVMSNMSTATNGTKSLVKIIRADSVGSYAWDSSGVNDWTASSLKTYLNETWYNSNLADYDDLLETVTWNLGETASYTSSSNGLASHWYGYERGTTVYSGRDTTWSGKIGLMYPSDYGYATSGGTTTDRATCLAKELFNWDSSSVSDCKTNDYLCLGSYEWTLTPRYNYSGGVFFVYSAGSVNGTHATLSAAVRPVGFLISNTKILSGNGTNSSPWIIGA